jgi:hypothetical protein
MSLACVCVRLCARQYVMRVRRCCDARVTRLRVGSSGGCRSWPLPLPAGCTARRGARRLITLCKEGVPCVYRCMPACPAPRHVRGGQEATSLAVGAAGGMGAFWAVGLLEGVAAQTSWPPPPRAPLVHLLAHHTVLVPRAAEGSGGAGVVPCTSSRAPGGWRRLRAAGRRVYVAAGEQRACSCAGNPSPLESRLSKLNDVRSAGPRRRGLAADDRSAHAGAIWCLVGRTAHGEHLHAAFGGLTTSFRGSQPTCTGSRRHSCVLFAGGLLST